MQQKDKSFTKASCRSCGTQVEHTFVDLGMSPLCESYLNREELNQMEPFYPLHVYVCHNCFLFDLGEFDQKGTVRTKYGTLDQLRAARQAARDAGLAIYIDTVLNHKGGADFTETVLGTPVSHENRNIEIGPPREIDAWTMFTFPGRGERYSSFQWRSQHFDAVDYDQRTGDRSIFKLSNKTFETPVDPERGNFDYLLFCDLDMNVEEVRNELFAWGEWIMSMLDVDGFRFVLFHPQISTKPKDRTVHFVLPKPKNYHKTLKNHHFRSFT